MSLNHTLKMLHLLSAGHQMTPACCDHCEYHRADMRDGGHCYMFKNMPVPTCAQFRLDTDFVASAEAAGEKLKGGVT